MSKRQSKDIKMLILKELNKKDLTFAQLERKINTGFRTIKTNCIELEKFGTIKITKRENHKATGRPYFVVSITKQGRKIINY